MAWQQLAPHQKIRATVRVIGGPVFTAKEIELPRHRRWQLGISRRSRARSKPITGFCSVVMCLPKMSLKPGSATSGKRRLMLSRCVPIPMSSIFITIFRLRFVS